MPRPRPTKNSTPTTSDRRLSEVAKHLVVPSGIVKTGYPAVAAQCAKMGVQHDDWQRALGRGMLAKRANGLYAAGIGGVIISICRQVGKTFTIGTIIFALCILFPRMKVLWTAHHSATSDETFDALAALARRRRIAPYIKQVRGGNGKQRITFTNGSRILFGAREHGFGRGIPGVTIVVFDEAQILTSKALNDMVPAANTVKNPLIIFMGTPPTPTDQAEFFKTRRRTALGIKKRRAAGELVESNMLYVEVGANPGDDPMDRAVRARANPSYPYRTPDDAIERLRELLGDEDSFNREGLGIWDEDVEGSGVIDMSKWAARRGSLKAPAGSVVLAVETSLDRQYTALVAVGAGKDGVPQARLVKAAVGTGWVAQLVAKICDEHREAQTVIVDGKGSSAPLIPAIETALEGAKLSVRTVLATYPDMAEACAITFDLIHEGGMRHADDAELTASVRGAVKRESEGAFVWSRRKGGAAVAPLVAMSLALWEWRRSDYNVDDSFL